MNSSNRAGGGTPTGGPATTASTSPGTLSSGPRSAPSSAAPDASPSIRRSSAGCDMIVSRIALVIGPAILPDRSAAEGRHAQVLEAAVDGQRDDDGVRSETLGQAMGADDVGAARDAGED